MASSLLTDPENGASRGTKRARPQSRPIQDNTASSSVPRLRAACDECRTKKLKCTGEQPNCTRCRREGITCVYSRQKQMGRPKKRGRSSMESEGGAHEEKGGGHAENTSHGGVSSSMVFTPGGGLQPWLQVPEGAGVQGWGADEIAGARGGSGVSDRDDIVNGDLPSAANIPELVSDSSTDDSPTTLPLQPELSQVGRNTRDASTKLLLDPSLSLTSDVSTAPGHNLGLPPTLLPSCACLSTMYLSLSTLQSTDPDTTPFPAILHPLREALQTAASVVICEECTTRFISAVQNAQLLHTLLMSTAERFGKVLSALNKESARVAASGERKRFRLADLNTSTAHLHTGGLGCAAAFSVSLDPDEWRSLCKKVVKAEVFGPEEGNMCCASLMGVLEQIEKRQSEWHSLPMSSKVAKAFDNGFFPKDKDGRPMGGPFMPKEDHVCVKFCKYTRKLVETYDWS